MATPLAIEVEDVHKTFRIPHTHRTRPLRRRLRRPLEAGRYRELRVLQDISFDVRRGEFFGIVGRNGSGKSTLLKLLASIYRADRGRIRMAGRLAPFLELGVGFNPNLPAYENVVLNGVMMGVSSAAARARFDEVIEFAGLEGYTDLKLKHYSSGMKVRLGFSIMTHVEADILLIDEVLAVGDAEFQERCSDVFRQMHDAGRTIVLVTHSMEALSIHCERAMLIDEGRITALGDPQEVSNRYVEANMRAAMARPGATHEFVEATAAALASPEVEVEDAWLEGEGGERIDRLESDTPIHVNAVIRAHGQVAGAGFFFRLNNGQGQVMFQRLHEPLLGSPEESLSAGERLQVRARIGNRLAPGPYVIVTGVTALTPGGTPRPLAPGRSVAFDVRGERGNGLMEPEYEIAAERRLGEEVAGR